VEVKFSLAVLQHILLETLESVGILGEIRGLMVFTDIVTLLIEHILVMLLCCVIAGSTNFYRLISICKS